MGSEIQRFMKAFAVDILVSLASHLQWPTWKYRWPQLATYTTRGTEAFKKSWSAALIFINFKVVLLTDYRIK